MDGRCLVLAYGETSNIREHVIKHLECKGYKQLNELMSVMEPLLAQYDLLFNDTDNFTLTSFIIMIITKAGSLCRRLEFHGTIRG
jgi:hypothetical protein